MIKIRKFKIEDAYNVSSIIKKCFLLVLSDCYPEEAVQEQIERNSPKNLIKRSKKINYFVAVEKNKILGIGGYSKIKIHTLFVDPKFHKKGIGKKMLEKILFLIWF